LKNSSLLAALGAVLAVIVLAGGAALPGSNVRCAATTWTARWDTRICGDGPAPTGAYAYGRSSRALASADVTAIDTNTLRSKPARSCSSRVPTPICGQRYHLAFDNEFNTLDRSTWDNHIWYDEPPKANQQFVRGGVLHLVAYRSQGYSGTSVTTSSSNKTFQYGYFEARIKSTVGSGMRPGWWLLSQRHATNHAAPSINPYCKKNGLQPEQCIDGEIDIYDNGGRGDVFFVGLHRSACECYGYTDQLVPYPNWYTAPKNLYADWHTYAVKWTPKNVTFYLDDQVVASVSPLASTNQPMFLILWNEPAGWDAPVTPSTPDEMDTQVDWVHVWQR